MKTCPSCKGPIGIRDRWCPACNEPVNEARTPMEQAWWHLDQAAAHIGAAMGLLTIGAATLRDATKRIRNIMGLIEARLEGGRAR